MSTVEKLFVLVLVVLSLLPVYWLKLRVRVPKGYKLPPGPPRKFFVGNLLDIPFEKEWETYHQWSKDYGDLTYLNICGTSILFVHSHQLVSELFEQRAGIYSDRVHSIMVDELVGWDWSTLTIQPNEVWKRHRAVLHQYLGKSAIVQHQELFQKSTRTLLHHLHITPDKFVEHIRHAIGRMTMEMTYGIKTFPENDPYVGLANKAACSLAAVTAPGACLVEYFPILKYVPSWVPGAGFKRKAAQLGEELTAMALVPFNATKAVMNSENPPFSIVGACLEEIANRRKSGLIDSEDIIRDISSTIYIAAIDTSDALLQVFFLVMVLHPDVQKKAQKELDDVVGENSMPSFEDRKNLPYIEALLKEVLRWHPVVPLAFPHMLKEDDIIGEYFVPKGTIIMGNTWSLLHSESMYGNDVDKFNPERFLEPNAKYPDSAFGFGRRICPGRHLADAMIFHIIACIVYTFNIAPYESSAGPELPDAHGFISGTTSRPQSFKCKINPRSPYSKALWNN